MTHFRPDLLITGLFIGLLLFMMSGCAFGTREVILRNSDAPVSPMVTKKHEICFSGLSDARKDTIVGNVQHWSGAKTADVVARNSVRDWVNTEIANQLESAGYRVNAQCTDQEHSIRLDGGITKAYTTAYFNYAGEVDLATKISLGQKLVLDKTFTGYFDGGTNMAATAESFGKTLEGSLNSAVSTMISEINIIDSSSLEVSGKDSTVQTIVPAAQQIQSSIQTDSLHADSALDSASILPMNGEITVIKGTRYSGDLAEVLSPIRGELKSMYKGRLEVKPGFSGGIRVRFTIAPNGTTSHIRIVMNSLNDQPIQNQLIASIQNAQFAALPEGSLPTVAVFEIKFNLESAHASKSAWIVLTAVILSACLIFEIINLSNAASHS